MQTPRDDWILHANLFRQDFPFVGLTSQASVTWNINRERGEIEVDDNGFPVRPALFGNLRARNYDAFYLGYIADGRIGRLNLTASAYALLGSDRNNVFTGRDGAAASFFFAAEPSFDFNWIRIRGAALFASGDGEPYRRSSSAASTRSSRIRSSPAPTPATGSARPSPSPAAPARSRINGRNGMLQSLRSSKEQGQSNFVNPGTMLLGVGADFDITPQLRVCGQRQPSVVPPAPRCSRPCAMQGTIRRDIGWDVSAAAI